MAAGEVVAEVAEEVAEEATEVAEIARSLTAREIKFLWGGIGLGLACGGVTAGLIVRRRLERKYIKFAEDEISEMRLHYEAKITAQQEKPPLEEVAEQYEEQVEDLGYSAPNLPKEDSNVETVEEEQEQGHVSGGPAHPVAQPAPAVTELPDQEAPEKEVVAKNVFEELEDESKDQNEGWDYEEEIRLRRPDRPYIIHYDERGESPDHQDISLIYYEADNVLANEQDQVIEKELVGEENLQKFGHGSPEKSSVFVRNDVIAMEFEINKNDGAYAEIVHGFMQHSETFFLDRDRQRQRMKRFDDD